MILKKLLFFLCLCSFSDCFSQSKANDILGYYMNPTGEGIVKIYEEKGKYFGKLVWMKEPDKLDKNNPDKSRHTEKILGTVIFKDFVFSNDNLWKNGTAYDPKNGKTYDCKITRDEKGNLNVRGYVGVSMLGRTDYFVKVNYKE
jgi:uncharacterized protein (DUF2147 family)